MVKERVLVVAAHADDEVIGCGGTIAKHIRQGNNVHIIFMTDGVTSRMYDPDAPLGRQQELDGNAHAIGLRKEESYQAAETMGVPRENVSHLMLADQRLDQYLLLDLIKRIEKIKKMIDPTIVYTHFWGDLNLDHRLTTQAVATAFRPRYDGVGIKILCFEVPETTRLSMPHSHQNFKFDVQEDISSFIELKMKALQCYASEQCAFPHPRSEKFLTQLAKDRGACNGSGFQFAEIFQHLRRNDK